MFSAFLDLTDAEGKVTTITTGEIRAFPPKLRTIVPRTESLQCEMYS
jgi:hypothetical protein